MLKVKKDYCSFFDSMHMVDAMVDATRKSVELQNFTFPHEASLLGQSLKNLSAAGLLVISGHTNPLKRICKIIWV